MLTNTFMHIPGVGPNTERKIWNSGCLFWEQALNGASPPISSNVFKKIRHYLNLSNKALGKNDAAFFSRTLPPSQWWRLYPSFKHVTAFLDIETTGLSRYYDDITMVGLFDGVTYRAYVQGQNLVDLKDQLAKYQIVVTYNGTLFDLPFLTSAFDGQLDIPPIHIDLRFLLRRLGFSGGLKAVEKTLGLVRDNEIQHVDGFEATVLWSRYIHGDTDALKQLVEYNMADVVNLKTLMEFACQEMKKRLMSELSPVARKPEQTELPRVALSTNGSHGSLMLSLNDDLAIPIDPSRNKSKTIKIADLFPKLSTLTGHPKVVGIDLSASGKRNTGWALLQGKHVETQVVSSDEDIIRATVNCAPHLISIDSPLSLPHGRDCTSDQCKCRALGITRACERILWKRGIRVFPCLLPSMQELTHRGMELSQKFRSLGYSVIESYPGAAQDILRMLRKKASTEELARGLSDFGLRGDFTSRKVTHDELDAITSAIVGYLYLAGECEAIGCAGEEYLIIPKTVKNLTPLGR